MSLRVAWIFALAALLAGPGCGEEGAPDAGRPEASDVPVVATTFYPLTYFARRIGADRVRVVCPVPADADPIFWMPSDEDIATYQRADLIVLNGAGFEQWVAKVSLPPAKVVDTARAFTREFLQFEQARTHSHGPAGEHTHSGLDGHTWLDPVQALAQADEIREALARQRPADAQVFARGFDALAADLRALDADLKALVAGYGGHFIYASHPAYNYLARRYGLKVVNFDLDPEAMPSDEAIDEIRAALEEKPATHLLWESEPAAGIAERLRKDLQLRSVTFSPCETLDGEAQRGGEDYLTVMHRNVEALRAVVAGE